MKYVTVSVDLLIPVETTNEGYVADAVSGILSENLQCDGVILDWQYSKGKYNAKPYEMPEAYEEGEAFNVPAPQNAKEFDDQVEPLVDQIQEIIDHMPDKGDKMEDSQKLCLVQALNEFSYTVNGVEDSDFVEDEDN